ncbi:copper homeostasis protein CutC [Luteolibacter arcticus]|uniref:PF03932 family protein CutC n=1 Tax=Luteolibacter arcticus TaxID=1581411 RepID=A0ABT3GFM2_9BACT|nr:copper homeostasis protein CutC [Luteolibacter arcticus]MCW1922053.1 copper homeostasis protein CutC [Luteolibacter arcticus]
MTLEICVDSLDSILACAEAGADRIELCASLTEGGLTPSGGMVVQARTLFPGEIAMMIRPRGGDFLYQPEEIAAMCADIELARDLGADAVVFGCLSPDGSLDLAAIETLLDACDGFPAVFHRAFDVCADLPAALEALAELGFERILTSGGAPSVMEALDPIAALVQQAGDRLEILPGGGIKPEYVAEIIRHTGVNQVHLSARSVQNSPMTFRRPEIPMGATTVPAEYERRVADAALIAAARLGHG